MHFSPSQTFLYKKILYSPIPSNITIKELTKFHNKKVKVKGKIRIVGSTRNMEMVLTIDSRIDLRLHFRDKKNWSNLSRYRGLIVEKEGTLIVKENLYKNPKYNHFRFYFTDIKVNF
jgi:hypothetical protein